jgi:NitT/TauT family transport system substrate-binding protein
VKTKFFLFADSGYPPYSTTLVTTKPYIDKNGDAVAKFVRATMQGWKDYLATPAAGNKLIKEANPKMEDDQIAYSIARFKAIKCITGGDAATMGIGTMTEARWSKTRDFMVSTKMLRADAPWKTAFTTQFVKESTSSGERSPKRARRRPARVRQGLCQRHARSRTDRSCNRSG